jgi:Domain of unknown function (DUF5655)/Domain of unknown function (DUF4287)
MKSKAHKLPGPPYGVHPGIEMVQNWVATLKEKTGRSLEEWLALVAKEGPADEKGRREWLKKEHGLGTNSAWWLAERSVGKGTEDDDPEAYLRAAPGMVDAMYVGKEGLRPLHDALIALAAELGPDVRACPCKTIVPLYRNHVFAQIKPATRKRIDLGFALGDTKATGRLIDTGGFAKKDRITHRIRIESEADIDDEVRRWLKAAYDRDAK